MIFNFINLVFRLQAKFSGLHNFSHGNSKVERKCLRKLSMKHKLGIYNYPILLCLSFLTLFFMQFQDQ